MRKSFFIVTFLSCILLFNLTIAFGQESKKRDEFKIKRGCVAFTPLENCRAAQSGLDRHFIVQFYEIPDAEERRGLEEAGIRFHRYIGGNAYIASKKDPAAGAVPALAGPEIRAVLNIPAKMKLSRIFRNNADLSRKRSAGELISFRIKFYPGVTLERATEILTSRGFEVARESYDPGRALEIQCAWPEIAGLLSLDEVEWIDHGAPARKLMNQTAAERGNVDHVRKKAEFRKADGANTNVGVWDGGPVYNHKELEGRLTIVEDDEKISAHATHVSGTIASSGKGKRKSQGMAPAAKIYSYDFLDNVVKEKKSAIKKYDIAISSNSWGNVVGWAYHYDSSNKDNCYYYWAGDWMFGYYHDEQAALDDFIKKYELTAFFAAGNDRGNSYLGSHKHESGNIRVLWPQAGNESFIISAANSGDGFYEDMHPSDPDYGSVTTWACAKNNLAVGATMKDDYMTGFSCWGPTDDGRVKPDVVANGYGLFSTWLDGEYYVGSGTSMATPTASGTAALLHDYFYRRHGKKISGLSLKNLVIHSARDLGNPGPDYIYGHGIVDGELGARVIRMAVFDAEDLETGTAPAGKKRDYDPDVRCLMAEDTLDHKQRHVYRLTIPENTKEFRATLVWHDPSGSELVNDLDLIVKPFQSKKVRPFVLDPKNPESAAKTGRNRRDNVESVKIASPSAGEAVVFVMGTKVPEGPQRYSLILSAGDGNRVPTTKTEGSVRLTDIRISNDPKNYDRASVFYTGDTFIAIAYGMVDENAQYEDYYGSLDQTWTITSETGDVILERFRASSNYGPGWQNGYFNNFMGGTYMIPSGMPRGTYTIQFKATMHNGQGDTKSATFEVK